MYSSLIEVALATRLKFIFIHKDKTGVPPRNGMENTGGWLKDVELPQLHMFQN